MNRYTWLGVRPKSSSRFTPSSTHIADIDMPRIQIFTDDYVGRVRTLTGKLIEFDVEPTDTVRPCP